MTKEQQQIRENVMQYFSSKDIEIVILGAILLINSDSEIYSSHESTRHCLCGRKEMTIISKGDRLLLIGSIAIYKTDLSRLEKIRYRNNINIVEIKL